MKIIKKHILMFGFIIITVLFLAGCSSLPTAQSGKSILTLNINTTQTSNYGKPFYVLITQDTSSDFINATEESLYTSFTNDEGSDKYKIFLVPSDGWKTKYLVLTQGKPISVYFLFSSNSYAWKYRISEFDKNTAYSFYLRKSSIDKVDFGDVPWSIF
ncbi:MAG TPA: type VI secretion system lipoprotein IglE [Victivallales bacterium]|nr:type VI secretion system lipoprotein IglE [Victivallales bacterium]